MKPESIRKLENELNIMLTEITSDEIFGWNNKKTFMLDDEENVIGLNLSLQCRRTKNSKNRDTRNNHNNYRLFKWFSI